MSGVTVRMTAHQAIVALRALEKLTDRDVYRVRNQLVVSLVEAGWHWDYSSECWVLPSPVEAHHP